MDMSDFDDLFFHLVPWIEVFSREGEIVRV